MSTGNPITPGKGIIERVKAILLQPKLEWPKIDVEQATTAGLFTGYAMILAAIGPVAGLLGGQIFGFGAFGFSYKPSLIGGIGMAVTSYVFSLIGVFILALIIDALAPKFGGQKNAIQALKVAVYASTAGWVAGIFSLVPALAFLGILGLYSLYLLYTGLPLLMKTPADKAMSYTVVTMIAGVVLFLIVGLIAAPVAGMFGGASIGAMSQAPAGEVTVPGIGKVDLDKIQAASAQMEAAAAKMETAAKTGESAAIAPATLQAMLPSMIGAYKRTEVESAGLGAGGSNASGRYEAGDRSFRVEITDMAALGALAGMGAALNVQSNKETATGYERTATVNGQLVNERWDKESGDGQYSMTIASRFMVEAEGRAASIDELKAAVAAVGPEKLAALAK